MAKSNLFLLSICKHHNFFWISSFKLCLPPLLHPRGFLLPAWTLRQHLRRKKREKRQRGDKFNGRCISHVHVAGIQAKGIWAAERKGTRVNRLLCLGARGWALVQTLMLIRCPWHFLIVLSAVTMTAVRGLASAGRWSPSKRQTHWAAVALPCVYSWYFTRAHPQHGSVICIDSWDIPRLIHARKYH